jgi:hypothetical protein
VEQDYDFPNDYYLIVSVKLYNISISYFPVNASVMGGS